jgi:ferrous-iron efflux pump FieF
LRDATPPDGPEARRLELSAGAASVGVALVLVSLKLWALWQTGALTVAASLADSALDLLASLGAIGAMLLAARPPDADHRFGHTSVEDLFALAQAVLVGGSALVIASRAVMRIGEPVALAALGPGLAVMGAAIVLTLALVAWQSHVARRTGSRVVAADRMHYLSDLLPNLGALAALGAALLWGVSWPDTVLGLVAAGMLLWGAWRLGRGAVDALMDREAEPETVARIAEIARAQPGIEGFHDLRTRRAGRRVFVQIHVEIDGRRPLTEAHDIGAALSHRIRSEIPGADVIVHKDPVRHG